ncbi:protein-disulfide reductase DsbD family protein [Lacipirellula limnantheis]|uniref:Thiol:disulfide interchange protein DsbD n=1 Tax=Lacipirellula limnantheis TaxID=2528024 RepID=A0A517TX82_9BACT|nr:thioredoxin family protein [Lacipirellula limnantheis]QDT72981.1 Thiol:disulfide interchange protein DsbD precursor [Lacipirellula limnantheis]
MASSRRYGRSGFAAAVWMLAIASLATAQVPDFGKFESKLGGGLGGFGKKDQKVTVTSEFTPPMDDAPAMLFVTAKIVPGLHLYAIDQGKLPDGDGPSTTVIKLDAGQDVKLLAPFQHIQQPTSHVDNVVWKGLELREHYDEVTWYAPVEFAASTDPAKATIRGMIDGQACDENSCTPVEVSFAAKVGKGISIPAASPTAAAGGAASSSSAIPFWKVACYGLLGGLILNLMPCVLPVIGLKVLSFAEQGGRSRAKVLGLNLAYVAGLLSVFMILATLAAAVQLGLNDENFGWGELYTLTWFKVAMAALVFSMALSFLGVWEIPIPGFAASSTASKLSAEEGPFGAFCMGIFTTLLATPCSGPFLGPVFGYTISQPAAVTFLVFGSVGVGMSLPYLLIGLFPSLVSWLPKPGPWMETLKHLLGFVLLGTVVYLFSTINQDYFLATLALLFGIWFGCWAIGRVPIYAETPERVRGWIVGILIAAVIGTGSFQLLTPSESALPWQPYSPQALAVARAQGKTVMVDFTADWCLTCKTNLKLAINREEVKQVVQENDVITLVADWTDKNDMIKAALLELNSQSIPLLAIYPGDPSREVQVLPDLLSKSQVLEALAEAGPSLDPKTAAVTSEKK